MSLSRMFKHAGLAAIGAVMMIGVGTVTAEAMPVQTMTDTVQHGVSPAGVETVQYYGWDRRRAWDRHERRFDRRLERRRERHYDRWERRRWHREWRRPYYY